MRYLDIQASRTAADDGIEIVAVPPMSRGEADRITVSVSDDHLELLLLHQPALFHRMRYKWAALTAVVKWLIKRLRTKMKDQVSYTQLHVVTRSYT